MRQDYIFFKRAFEDNSQSPMWAYMHAYFVKRYTDIAMEKTRNGLDAQTRFSIRLYCYGTIGMTQEWLMHHLLLVIGHMDHLLKVAHKNSQAKGVLQKIHSWQSKQKIL